MAKKIYFLAVVILSLLLIGCSGSGEPVEDGIYRIELETVDVRGYKDFIEFQFTNGQLSSMKADAVEPTSGSFKSSDTELKADMQETTGTYPEKVYKDLVNQYIEKQSASQIDIIAGATTSSENFISLMEKAERAVRTNNFDGIVKIG